MQKDKQFTFGQKLLLSPEFGIVVPVLIMSIVTSIIKPQFLVWGNIQYIIEQSMYVGLLALAQAIVITVGEIDLSVGMLGGFAACMVGVAAEKWGVSPIVAILVGIAVGAAVGFINGFVSTRIGVTPWIVTLATQFITAGVTQFISDGKVMHLTNEAYKANYERLANFKAWTIPKLDFSSMFLIFIAILIIYDYVIRHTKFGYRIRAVGGNADAALLAGINVKNYKLYAFTVSGMFAGFYGVFFAIKQMATSLSQGSGGEFRAITCCAIGGILMSGGKVSIYGVGLGVLLFHVVNGALQSLGADNNVQLLMVGGLLVLAVLLEKLRQIYERSLRV